MKFNTYINYISLGVAVLALIVALRPSQWSADQSSVRPVGTSSSGNEARMISPISANAHLQGVVGVVVQVQNNTLYVKSGTSQTEESIILTDGTQIVRQGAKKDAATFQKEIAALPKSGSTTGSDTIPPSPYTTTPATQEDLKPNTMIYAWVKDGTAVQVIIAPIGGQITHQLRR